MLSGRGFTKVYNLSGGIKAWDGLTAEGPVELNLNLIQKDPSPLGITKSAYGMEQALGDFYRKVAHTTDNAELKDLLTKLASIEDKHKDYVFSLYTEVASGPEDRSAFEKTVNTEVLEGGYNAEEYMERNKKFLASPAGVLDLAMMLEAQALDLYLRFADVAEKAGAKEILFKISDEEKTHLTALGNLRAKY